MAVAYKINVLKELIIQDCSSLASTEEICEVAQQK